MSAQKSPADPSFPAAQVDGPGVSARPQTEFLPSPGRLPLVAYLPLALLGAIGLWTFWPTLRILVNAWSIEPDYSHGFFVIPLALYFLWLNRENRPQIEGPAWGGLVLVTAGLALDLIGTRFYLEPVSGWALIVWLAGVVWLIGGRKFWRWCLPSLLFLIFMVPLPFRIEGLFRQPLQRVATEASCWTLQSLGFAALAEGNVLSIDDVEFEVAQACSGLRIFVSIVALAFAYAVIVRRPWWTKVLLFASTLPIAIVANSIRVTLIGATYFRLSTPAAHRLAHDMAGWFVIPLAAALMGALIWYLGKLFVEVQPLSGKELLAN